MAIADMTIMKQCSTKLDSRYLVGMTLNSGGFRAKLRTTIERLVPAGYQDETGFHFGVQCPPKASNALTLGQGDRSRSV